MSYLLDREVVLACVECDSVFFNQVSLFFTLKSLLFGLLFVYLHH